MKVVTCPVVVELDGPVTMPVPDPFRAFDDVIVLAEAAMGTCPVVIPDRPAFEHPTVVAPPLESTQSVLASPEMVPAVRIATSVPCKGIDEVTVVEVAASGICPPVIPERPPPLPPEQPTVVSAPPVPFGQIGLVLAAIEERIKPFVFSVIAQLGLLPPPFGVVPDAPAELTYQ